MKIKIVNYDHIKKKDINDRIIRVKALIINSKKEIRQERVNNMLDIKFVRNNPDVVKQNIKNKFQDEKLPLVDEVIELDQKNRDIKGEVEALRAEKNKISKQIGACMAQGKKEEAEELKAKFTEAGAVVELA